MSTTSSRPTRDGRLQRQGREADGRQGDQNDRGLAQGVHEAVLGRRGQDPRELSAAIDRLWQQHVEQRRRIRDLTKHTFPLFGKEDDPAFQEMPKERRLTTREKERIWRQEVLSENVRNSSPYRRLKLAMDYWCALWFWPIEKADLLPSRDEHLLDLTMILEGAMLDASAEEGQGSLFPDSVPREQQMKLLDQFGFVDVDKLCREVPRLGVVKEIAEHHRFLHWELEFADVFHDRGGFDLIVGNPPWIKVEWNEGGLMGDHEPLFVLREFSASKVDKLREETIERHGLRGPYLEEFVEFAGTQNFLNATQNYPLLKGSQSNLYKCFLPQAWMAGASAAHRDSCIRRASTMIPTARTLRTAALSNACGITFSFTNETDSLFADVDHHATFSVNIYSDSVHRAYAQLAKSVLRTSPTCLHPPRSTSCFDHAGDGRVGGIKNDRERVEHRRARPPNRARQRTGARRCSQSSTMSRAHQPLQARLPSLHARELVDRARKICGAPEAARRSCRASIDATEMWHETNAADRRHDPSGHRHFRRASSEWILSGPHISCRQSAASRRHDAVCAKNSRLQTCWI